MSTTPVDTQTSTPCGTRSLPTSPVAASIPRSRRTSPATRRFNSPSTVTPTPRSKRRSKRWRNCPTWRRRHRPLPASRSEKPPVLCLQIPATILTIIFRLLALPFISVFPGHLGLRRLDGLLGHYGRALHRLRRHAARSEQHLDENKDFQ